MPALPKCRSLAQSLGSWGLKFCLPEDLLGQRRPNNHLKQRFSYPVYDKTHLRGFYKTNTGPHPYGLVLWIWGPDERGTIRNKSLTLKPRQAQNSCLLLSSASWMLGWQAWVSNLQMWYCTPQVEKTTLNSPHPDEKSIKVKTVPPSTKQNSHTEKREAERGKVILCLLCFYLVSNTLTPTPSLVHRTLLSDESILWANHFHHHKHWDRKLHTG